MIGSLALENGLLYIGTEEKTARVRVFDLDGRPVGAALSFRDPRLGRSRAAGIAVDTDHRVWVADTPASRVRRFTLFGVEEGGIGIDPSAALSSADTLSGSPVLPDRPGLVRQPVAVAVSGHADEGTCVIGSAGERRHAVQVFDFTGRYRFSPKPGGDAHGRFRGVRGLALRGSVLTVAEQGRVQVFRDGDFHFAFSLAPGGGRAFEPTAVRPLEDGRMVIACAGRASALLLVDGSGRLISVLAECGEDPGCVRDPSDVVVEEGTDDARRRVVAIDREGERVQVFTLAGRCYGAFLERA